MGANKMVAMKKLTLLIVSVMGLLQAQDTDGPQNSQAAVTPVPFNRILGASQTEPQNWLTYSGSYSSQRFSGLNQITPENAKDLTLKWVFQSQSLEKHEVTPLVIDGVMYTIQSPNDVIALDAQLIAINAKTGKEVWKTQVADYKQWYSMTVAPIVIKDKVISGVAGGE